MIRRHASVLAHGSLATIAAALLGVASVIGGSAAPTTCQPVGDPAAPRVNLVVQLDTTGLSAVERATAVEQAAEVLEHRLELYGDPTPIVAVLAEDALTVAVPGTWSPDAVAVLLGRRARMEFRAEQQGIEGQTNWMVAVGRGSDGAEEPLTGAHIAGAELSFSNGPEVLFELDPAGTALLADITQRLVGRRLGIFLDDDLLIAPTIFQPIRTGRGRITGAFSADEACILAAQLRSGPLPVRAAIMETTGSGRSGW
jgi:SecD/SecF fusion protein